MSRTPLIILLSGFLGAVALTAQVLPPTSVTSTIQAQGSATISVKPDQAQLIVSVSTDGTTAADASQKNATIANQLLAALNQTVDGNGTVQTIGYAINVRYSNGSNPSVIGYTAVNTIQITTGDLSHLGNLIDTAVNNGANNIGALSFSLHDPEPQTQQALTAATKQALAHAAAIAAGTGRSVGPVVSAVQGGGVVPVVYTGALGAATVTPIQTGYSTVSATVTVTVQLQ